MQDEMENKVIEGGLQALDAEAIIPEKAVRPGRTAALVGLAVLLLVGAAFLGGRLLNGQGFPQGIGKVTFADGNGGMTSVISLQMEEADVLPKEKSVAQGILDHRVDKSLFIGSGNVMAVGDGVSVSFKYDGPIQEVVVNHDTTIYKDTTDFESQDDNGVIHQVVEPGSLDDIQKNMIVSAWGEKQGERVLAKVLVYR